MKTTLRWVVIICIAGLVVGILIAQAETETPEADEEPISCENKDLAARQIELSSLLASFSDDLESDSDITLGTLYEVGLAYQEIALTCGYIPPNAGELTVGTDVERILNVLDTLRGDPFTGQLLYNSIERGEDGSELGCSGCHSEETVAPLTIGTWTRWDEIVSQESDFADYTFEQYIVESLVNPTAFVVPDYIATMPQNFGDRLNYQNLADIVAHLETQDQLLDE